MQKGTEEYRSRDRERARQYRIQNRDAILERKRKKDNANREEVNRRQREWLETPAGLAARARRLERYRLNRADHIKRARDWVVANPERRRETNNLWYAKSGPLQLLRHARQRARKLGLPIDLAAADIVIPDVCPVLGEPIVIGVGKFTPNSPTLDRLIPSLGYVKGNVCVISHRANALKRDATLAELEALVAYVRRELG